MSELPSKVFYEKVENHSLLIIEDLWFEACKNEEVVNAFKVYSGKKNLSIFITSQHPFEGKYSKTIRNNLNYYLLFKNISNTNINKTLTKQLDLYGPYKEAIKKLDKYEFIFINLDLSHENCEKLMCNLFSKPLLIK